METIIEIIKRRVSVRTYSGEPIPSALLERLTGVFEKNSAPLFGNHLRFSLAVLNESQRDEVKQLSTYGVIRNAGVYMLGAVSKGPRCMTDFGYAMEKNILEASSLGLGTCWLGGTFSRSGFSRRMDLRENEVLPAVSPVGFPAGRRSLVDGIFRFAASSHARRPWPDLYYAGNPSEPLSPSAAGGFVEALECVRLAPSASNKQPWRVIKENGAAVFHFYSAGGRGSTPASEESGEIRFHEIDMGIALCHFELASRALGRTGEWQRTDSARDVRGWDYFLSWSSA